jgi:hypothetical protein
MQTLLSIGTHLTLIKPAAASQHMEAVTTPINCSVQNKVITVTTESKTKRKSSEAVRISQRVTVLLRIIGGTAVALDMQVVLDSTAEPMLVKAKRIVYTGVQKAKAVEVVMATGSPASWSEKARQLNKTSGYEKVTAYMLSRWAVPMVGKKRGRPRRERFERDVLDQLIYTSLEKVNSADKVAVIANVAFSYEVIKFAAYACRKCPSIVRMGVCSL